MHKNTHKVCSCKVDSICYFWRDIGFLLLFLFCNIWSQTFIPNLRKKSMDKSKQRLLF
jgi:hypothetical protein